MRVLDLYCGAGGAGMGYKLAGFAVVGCDLHAQPNYPFAFVRVDALEALKTLIAGEAIVDRKGHKWYLRDFDLIHASPPCQAHSDPQKQSKREYPELIEPTRELLKRTKLPYVIENVEGSPLVNPIKLCGTMFPGLRVIRHRLFEANFPITPPEHPKKHPIGFTHDKRKAHYGKLDQDKSFVQVTGGGNCSVANKLDAMGVDWMTGKEANEAIPPAYTEWIGGEFLYQRRFAQRLRAKAEWDAWFNGAR